MAFERRDPFPLKNEFSKSEALAHASLCDQWLGLHVSEIEEQLAKAGSVQPAPNSSGDHQQLWFGLAPHDLQTPYYEIRRLLAGLMNRRWLAHDTQLLRPQLLRVVDLDAAYARMAFVIERHFPLMTFTGYEYVGERVREARRALHKVGAERSTIEHVDLTSQAFRMPRADVYFIYDYGTPQAIEKTLHDLRREAQGRNVIIIARGRVCRYAIESRHAYWLKKSDPLASESTVSIYESSDVSWIKAPVQNEVEIIDRANHAEHDRQI